MVFAEILNTRYTILQMSELFLRIVVACLCGLVFGFERSYRLKEAGVRTHLLVCATAALLMIISKYAFADLPVGDYGMRGADDARIAAQVVSGIGFLCTGVIIKEGGNIRGLTTAAGLWMTAAVGLALGAGLYFVGIFMVLLVTSLQYVLHRFSLCNDRWICSGVMVRAVSGFPVEEKITEFLADRGGQCEMQRIVYGEKENMYHFQVRTKRQIGDYRWQIFFEEYEEIMQIEFTARL